MEEPQRVVYRSNVNPDDWVIARGSEQIKHFKDFGWTPTKEIDVFQSKIKSLIDVTIKLSAQSYELCEHPTEVVQNSNFGFSPRIIKRVHVTYAVDGGLEDMVGLAVGLIRAERAVKPEGGEIKARPVTMLLRSVTVTEKGDAVLRCCVYGGKW